MDGQVTDAQTIAGQRDHIRRLEERVAEQSSRILKAIDDGSRSPVDRLQAVRAILRGQPYPPLCTCGHTRAEHNDTGGCTDLIEGACGECACAMFVEAKQANDG